MPVINGYVTIDVGTPDLVWIPPRIIPLRIAEVKKMGVIPEFVSIRSKMYAGVGSRKADESVCEVCTAVAMNLAQVGLLLRSGYAKGCDKAFEKGCDKARGEKEIILPWERFEGSHSKFVIPNQHPAYKIASQIHGHWNKCTNGAKKLLARNVIQILGMDLKHPVDFVVCWTPRGKEIGGTRIALTVARMNNIPTFNLSYCCTQEIYKALQRTNKIDLGISL